LTSRASRDVTEKLTGADIDVRAGFLLRERTLARACLAPLESISDG
jgi:hypothetical protein